MIVRNIEYSLFKRNKGIDSCVVVTVTVKYAHRTVNAYINGAKSLSMGIWAYAKQALKSNKKEVGQLAKANTQWEIPKINI